MNNELRMLINNLTQDIIDLYNIQIPIENINNVVMNIIGHISFFDLSNSFCEIYQNQT